MKVQNINSGFGIQKKQNRQPNFQRNWSEHASWGANYIKETGKTNFKLFSFPDAKAVFVEVGKNLNAKLGNIRDRLISVISAGAGAITVSAANKDSEVYPMENKGNGVFTANDIQAKPDDKYRFVVVTKDNDINLVKDPYAKRQENILGWSSIYNQEGYEWKHLDWFDKSNKKRITRQPEKSLRGLDKLIIDEVNIPTLSKEGTFEAAKTQIDKIASKGFATAIELMPVENTFSKQWGYDGVDKFAANENLGGPDKLKELVDYIHGKGLNVIIDMVPNHMGPDGDFLAQTGPYIKGSGAFGNLLNYEGDNSRYVRDWMTNAALWWANEFKVDGLRFDLTNPYYTGSDYLLREIALEVNHHNPDVFLIAEDHMHKRHEITSYYNNPNLTHEQEINRIDDNIAYRDNTSPRSIGFDSEWDSEYKDAISKAVLDSNPSRLDDVEWFLKSSHFRVKYAYSHDEIGNEDGTRFLPKYLVRHFYLFSAVNGNSDGEKGQRAAQAAQKLCELIVSKNFANMTDAELDKAEKECGLTKFISKDDLTNTFKTALAKQKLLTGVFMTTPGPKMFFQGDDDADLSHFKFFRELSGTRYEREKYPNANWSGEKGYDTLEEVARPDSVVGRVKYEGLFKDVPSEMQAFNRDLRNLLDECPAMAEGEINSTYKDHNHNVHIHTLKYGNDELLILKHFGNGFLDKNYSYYNFPQDSKWEEVLNSDDVKFGGSGYTNKNRAPITNMNQNLSLAPNSIVILRKIN